ncbi:MAG: glycosyltransferase family 9 protein [Alphaproteobacteria bacterium]|nr:glycosyltransferase family 9 protein [Alphaproteobacteria bacterium]
MRLLFISYNRIGDAVLSTGLLGHLIERRQGLRIWVACGPQAVELFQPTPGVERVIALTKQPLAGHWLALWRQAGPWRWDLVVDLRASLIAYFLSAGERRVLRPDRAARHRLQHLGALFGLDPPPRPRLWPTAADGARAASLLPAGGPILALAPGANWGGKVWPAERFAELVGRLTASGGPLPGARLLLLGAPGERAICARVAAALPAERVIDIAGRAGLLTAFACLRRVSLFVGNDSAAMHLAATTGQPTLGLFGPSREERYGPWGAHGASVRGERSFREIVGQPGYDYRRQDSHMLDLSVDKVEAAARALLARGRAVE